MSPEHPQALWVALQVIGVLERLGIDYHLGGSYASSIHGVPRQTQDVDLVADLPTSLAVALVEGLGPDYYADAESALRAAKQRSSFNVLHLATGVKVDIFCLGDSAFDRAEFERARPAQLRGLGRDVEVRIKSPEDTVLRKLAWFRSGGEVSDRQWGDVVGCLEAQGETLDRSYLERWAAELGVQDLLERAWTDSRT